jgi:DNA-binding transcriptional LysR family regulator
MAIDGRLLGGIGVLAAVVETGNFARAGEALGLTPSGISRAVARLEARVGVRLLDRTPRAVTLTDEGRRFHAQVAPLLAGLEEAATDAAHSAFSVRGRLRVNVDSWLSRLVLAPRLPAFLASYPAALVEVIVRDTLGDLVGEGIDVAVRFGGGALPALCLLPLAPPASGQGARLHRLRRKYCAVLPGAGGATGSRAVRRRDVSHDPDGASITVLSAGSATAGFDPEMGAHI